MTTNLKPIYNSLRDLIVITDATGKDVVRVHLKGGEVAVVERQVFESLMRFGVSPNWFLNLDGSGNYSYVRAMVPPRLGWGNVANVSRLVAMPEGGSIIRHIDGDRLNLRRSNLVEHESVTKATGWEGRLPHRAALFRAVSDTGAFA